MIIPFWALLIPVGVIALFVIIFALINLLQVYRFGFVNATTLLVFTIFVILAGIVVLQTFAAIGGVDWSAPLTSANFGSASDIIDF